MQRGSLVPVPDVLQYQDQLEEINLLTGRIHALSDALEVKGFYPAGGGEIAEAMQTAITTQHAGPGAGADQQLGGVRRHRRKSSSGCRSTRSRTTITALVALRKQVIEDIYQIMGLSDIMRGATDPQRDAGRAAAQDASTARPGSATSSRSWCGSRGTWCEITAEIITEKFDEVTIIEMARPSCRPSKMIDQQMQQIMQQAMQAQQQAQQMLQSPQAQQAMQQKPDQVKQMMEQFQQMQADGAGQHCRSCNRSRRSSRCCTS